MIENIYDISFEGIDGEKISLKNYAGKLMLIVNTASLCGFTKQYKALQTLHERYHDKGLVIIAIPSSDFGQQEYVSNSEIKNFCETNFHINFTLTIKQSVKGENAHPFFILAHQKFGSIGAPKWNFHKYLVSKSGEFIDWFSSFTSPTSSKIIKAIEENL